MFYSVSREKKDQDCSKTHFLNLPFNKITHKDAMKKSNSQAFFIEINEMFYDYWRLIATTDST